MPTCAKREKKRGEKRQDKERDRRKETERNEVCVTISLARKSQRGTEQKK